MSSKEYAALDLVLEAAEEEELALLKTDIRQFLALWTEFGMAADKILNKFKDIFVDIRNYVKEIFDKENYHLKDLEDRTKNYSAKIRELASALKVTPRQHEGVMFHREESLRRELDDLTKLKYARIKSFKELKKEMGEYCHVLGIKEHDMTSRSGVSVPSAEDLIALEQHINTLKIEKDTRYQKWFCLRTELITLFQETGLPAETSLAEDNLTDGELTSLSNETFDVLEEAVCEIRKKKAKMEDEKSILVAEIKIWWKRLKTVPEDMEEFLSEHPGCSVSTLHFIREELERCKTAGKDNAQEFAMCLRQELEQLWQKCYVSADERRLFWPYIATEITEQVLDALEEEVEKWQKYYDSVKAICEKIESRRELFDLMTDFEVKATNPKRFKNKTHNLLEEERDRKHFQSRLPALEEEIIDDIKTYEKEKQTPFLYYGQSFKEFVNNQWNEHNNKPSSVRKNAVRRFSLPLTCMKAGVKMRNQNK